MNKTIKTLHEQIEYIKNKIEENESLIKKYAHKLSVEQKELREHTEEIESINKDIKILESIYNE